MQVQYAARLRFHKVRTDEWVSKTRIGNAHYRIVRESAGNFTVYFGHQVLRRELPYAECAAEVARENAAEWIAGYRALMEVL